MLRVLDTSLSHRTRTIEGKDGNALNEVRVLGNSILQKTRAFSADEAIKLKPETSVLSHFSRRGNETPRSRRAPMGLENPTASETHLEAKCSYCELVPRRQLVESTLRIFER
jgi:hypothetical protein